MHRLGDGQSKHSPEAFYAGSLWKVRTRKFPIPVYAHDFEVCVHTMTFSSSSSGT